MATIRANVPLTFGLVSVPVNVQSSVKDPKEEVSCNTVCDGSHRLNNKKPDPHIVAAIQSIYRCPLCDNEDKDLMKKGRNLGGGSFVLVDEDELAKSILGKDDINYKAMVLNVHRTEEIGGITPAGSFYNLAPSAAAGESYNLIVQMLRDCPEYTLITTWAIKTKLAPYRLLVVGDTLAIEKFAWPEDVHPLPIAPALPVQPTMLAQAKMLLEMTCTPFDLVNYRDERRAGLAAWIAGQSPVAGLATADKATEKVVTGNLNDQLAAMIAAAKTPEAKEVKAKTTTRKARTKVVEVAAETPVVEIPAKKRVRKQVTPKA